MVLDKPVVDNAGTSPFSSTGSANAHLAEATAVRNKRAEVRPFDQDILECLIFVWGDPRSQALSERGKLDKFHWFEVCFDTLGCPRPMRTGETASS